MPTPIRTLTLSAALLSALALTACSPGGAEQPTGLRVVTTTTQLTDFVEQVGGDAVQVTGLMDPGGSAHQFDPTPADLLALGQADVLVINGVGLETFLADALDASGFSGATIDVSEGFDLDVLAHAGGSATALDHGDHGHEAHEAHEAHDHSSHSEDAHTHEVHENQENHDHEAHDHGPVNPHIWTSPKNAEIMVEEIAAGLELAEPSLAPALQENAAAYLEQLHALDDWVASNLAAVPAETRQFVSGHNSLAYYLHDYGITFVGSILPSFEDNAEPSPAALDELIAGITGNGVTAIFVESSMSPKLAETIGRDAGVRVLSEQTLFADSLGTEGSGAETYIRATILNTQTLLDAWGATPTELPQELL